MRIKSAAKRRRDLAATAYHEAGHALADHVLGFHIRSVTVFPGKGFAGRVTGRLGVKPRLLEYSTPSRATVAKWHDKVVSLLAGGEAQRIFKPQSVRAYMLRSDRDAIVDILISLHPEEMEMKAAFKFLRIRARNLLTNRMRWRQVEDLAQVLIEKGTLTGEEVRSVFFASCKRHIQRECSAAPQGRFPGDTK